MRKATDISAAFLLPDSILLKRLKLVGTVDVLLFVLFR
jgi:hypothetical protein